MAFIDVTTPLVRKIQPSQKSLEAAARSSVLAVGRSTFQVPGTLIGRVILLKRFTIPNRVPN